MPNNRSHAIFWTCMLIAGTLLLQMTLYMLQSIFRWSLPLNVFNLCHTWLGSMGWPFIQMMLDVLIVSTFAVSVWLCARQAFLLMRAKRRIRRMTHTRLTEALDREYIGGSGRLTVIGHAEPVALTMGFIRPRIILSTGLIRILEREELEAVIRHEQYHLLQLDPLKTLLTYLASSVLWYVPILKWCHSVYKISCEVMADRYAVVCTGGSPAGLGGALLKLVRVQSADVTFAHASFTDTSMNVRIRQLVDPDAQVPFRMPWKAALISISVTAAITGLLLPAPL
ncbi:M56 family metallopeptidase [Gorillibacterium sp. sgz5001074]|uniref:M56 family metallopeptidase n=1 Tax=Gorillibacterium sp. sgz5001074 TaxID=3446695 RepID=UPI003F680B61